MRFPRPGFLSSPYIESGKREGDPAWIVRADAPQDVREELQRQIDEWEKNLAEARRGLGYPA